MRNELANVHVCVVVDVGRVVETYYCYGHSVLFVKHRNSNNFHNCTLHFQFLLVFLLSYYL